MDNEKNQIPVNTRTVGNPGGIYLLYIEDYVHTFWQKNLDENLQGGKINMALYGVCFEEDGTLKFVVSGAAKACDNPEELKYLNYKYFPKCTQLGTAFVTRAGEGRLYIELKVGSVTVVIEDYYIYYDQNEEMQNYLIDWNEKIITVGEGKTGTTKKNGGVNDNKRGDEAVRYSRVLQAYNREEAKVGVIWNIMNILCLGLAACVMAYGVLSINSYNKMKSLQAQMEYCMSLIVNNTNNTLTAMSEDVENEIEEEFVEITMEVAVENATGENLDEGNSDEGNSDEESSVESSADEVMANQTTAQYYIVQKGDTLRTICLEIYGDYSYVDKVCEWNGIEDADNILCGQRLLLH